MYQYNVRSSDIPLGRLSWLAFLFCAFGLCTLEGSFAQVCNADYSSCLQMAKIQTLCLNLDNEQLPVFDETSQSVKAALCNSRKCKRCKQCAMSLTDVESGDCLQLLSDDSTESYSLLHLVDINSDSSPIVYFSEDTPLPPSPSFQCSSHLGKNYTTHFKMEYPNNTLDLIDNTDLIPRVFVVEKETDGNWEIFVQQFWFIKLQTKLMSTYRIRVTAVAPSAIYKPQTSISITIHDIERIDAPKNARLVRTVVKDATRLKAKALIHWDSNSGLNASCDYDVYYMDDDMFKKEIDKAENAFWLELDDLSLGRNYTVGIIEKFGSKQSEKAMLHVAVPTCLDFFNKSFQRCPPPVPASIHVDNETSSSFWVVWSPPLYTNETNKVLEYLVSIERFVQKADGSNQWTSLFSGRIEGNITKLKVENDEWKSPKGKLHMSVIARSEGGDSKSCESWYIPKPKVVSSFSTTGIVVVTLVVLVVLVASLFLLKSFRDKMQRQRKRHEYFENLDKESTMMTPIIKNVYASKWEIDMVNLEMGNVIGVGNFGLVRKAILHRHGEVIPVAVKTLKESVETKDVDKFWEEFEILKGLERHRHVVGLVGVVQKPEAALIVEFCDGGDLQTHLRKAYHAQVDVWQCESDLPPFGAKTQDWMVTNEAYFAGESQDILGPVDLLSYARQVACGMEFLALNKIVHRDLAARNILISGSNRTLKIADFGLSRDIYEQNCYKKSSNGKIPFKWLAVESLLQEVYTSQSDVWSYGILLWEIVTYGGNPYPGVDNTKIFDKLKAGYRMSKPANCSDELYILMKRCWAEKPQNRPDFPSIRRIIEEMIERCTNGAYLAMEADM